MRLRLKEILMQIAIIVALTAGAASMLWFMFG